MRLPHQLRLLILLAVCVSVALGGGSARAQPADQPAEPERLGRALREGPPLDGEEALHADEVEAVASYRRLTIPQARRLIALERRVDTLQRIAEEQFPDTFAGLWMDYERVGDIRLAFTADAARSAAAAAREFARPDAVRSASARFSLQHLEGIRDRLLADQRGAREDFGIVGFGIDVAANELVVTMLDDSAANDARIQLEYGFHELRIKRGSIGFDEDIPPFGVNCRTDRTDCNPLRGGTTLTGPNGRCTFGFNAVAGTRRFMISAAHCPDTFRNHSGSDVGPVVAGANGGSVDAQLTEVFNGAWFSSRTLFHRGGTAEAYEILQASSTTRLAQNTGICVSGVSSGLLCGAVTDSSYSGTVNSEGEERDYFNMLRYNMCTRGGDSGAPLYASNTAFGVHKGDTGEALGECTKWASYISNVQRVLGAAVRTS